MDQLLSLLAISTLLIPLATPNPLPDRIFIRNATSPSPNKTIADMVQRQTDTIKKIVSNHQSEYPVVTRHPPDKQTKTEAPLSLDELKMKCQHLARLASTTTPTPPGFYVTSDSPPVTTPRAPTPPVKYIKLEPVILQKTIMSDGRTVYYWHKSIPSAISSAQVTPSTPPPTTTTTSGYYFGSFFPSFYSTGGSESAVATTTEKTTAPEKPEEVHLYQQQLKFVVPVPYAPPNDPGVKKPWEINQYAYYPKPLQPENVKVPYVPTFHVIKAIAVPNEFEGASKEHAIM